MTRGRKKEPVEQDGEEIRATTDIPRRRGARQPAPEMPTGYRASKRGSRTAKKARKAQKAHAHMEHVTAAVDRAGRYAWLAGRVGVLSVAGAIVAVLLLLAIATGVNAVARWLAHRDDGRTGPGGVVATDVRDNLLVIARDGERAHAFLALRVDASEKQVWGLAIPATVFAEVPGRGFERIGDSLAGGAPDALIAVSNFLGVQFERYVIVDKAAYQTALESQSVAGLLGVASADNLTEAERSRLGPVMSSAAGPKIGIAPLPVKPISLGEEEYLEAEREKVDDLIAEWWGVRPGMDGGAVSVIVYNGSGAPTIAAVAAKSLVRAGFRVVGTGNADNFDYARTVIAVHSGEAADGERVREALKVGSVVAQESEQEIADVIVIIGKDFKPPAGDG